MDYIKYLSVAIFLCVATSVKAQNKHFEGEVIYSVSATLDKTASKFFKGTNGEYQVKTVMKNGNEKTQENYFGTITYIFRDKDEVYGYSPLTKKGYKCTYSASVKDYQNIRKAENSTVAPTGETKELHGIRFEHFKGEDVTKMDLLGTTITGTDYIDYWVCRDYDENWIMSIKIPGLYQSVDLRSAMRLPLLGSAEQRLEISIEELTAREVKDDEFALPSDITFTEVATMYNIESALKKDYKKYKKAQGKKQGENVKEEGASKVKGDWDF